MEILDIKTSKREELIDITPLLRDFVKSTDVSNGILFIYSPHTTCIYSPHTTCGITINENADPSVKSDIIQKLKDIIPYNDRYTHMEGNSDAHIKTSLIGNEIFVCIEDSDIVLGTWQGIFLAEFDGPRTRKVWLNLKYT
jgi:secondary thiamine-phosphate synthase enzyme